MTTANLIEIFCIQVFHVRLPGFGQYVLLSLNPKLVCKFRGYVVYQLVVRQGAQWGDRDVAEYLIVDVPVHLFQ